MLKKYKRKVNCNSLEESTGIVLNIKTTHRVQTFYPGIDEYDI